MQPTEHRTTHPQQHHPATKPNFTRIETQIARMETRLIRWIVGVAIAQAALIVSATIYFS